MSLDSVNGKLVEVEDIKEGVYNHFKNRFSEPIPVRLVLDDVCFNSLSDADRAFLEATFSIEEIESVV